MLIGVVGAPNKGKSTFFSAATMVDAQIANYPFTTISPNKGVTYVRAPCPHMGLGLPKCDAKNSKCIGGIRLVPVNMVDVPGLVPDAHLGKGLGNRFLDSIREADALIQVVDATGKTDLYGNFCEESSPILEVEFLKEEIGQWLAGILMRKEPKPRNLKEIALLLSGLKISERMLLDAASRCGLDISEGLPDKEGVLCITRKLVEMRMPIAIACNKADVEGARKNYEAMKAIFGERVFFTSAAIELALRKASEKGIAKYVPGDSYFEIVGKVEERQMEALDRVRLFLAKNSGSGVQQIIDWVVYNLLGGIIVYPVEDEHKYSNHKGEVLPDALLVPKGTTALQLAEKVHTELAQKFIGAFDVKRKIRIGAESILSNGDVIKIIASR
ncbi:MAG: YchF-related putative GTPase [Candidatus Anstonellaceae archaeon]